MNGPIQTGILAYGMSGKVFHAPFVACNRRFHFRAVTERNKKEANKRYPGIISYDSVVELLNDKAIELVIINTPNNTHFEYAREAILAGKHVLIEKPCVATKEEAQLLFALGKEHQKYVMVYQNRRWDSDFKMIRSVLDSGKLGHLIEAHFRFDRYRAEIGPKVFKEQPFPASGIAYDLGSHLVDQVISLFGKPGKSLKIGTKNREKTAVDDYVNFILSYPTGLQVYVTVSSLVADQGPGYILHGTKGSFKKNRTDIQEIQLSAGTLPTDPGYGVEGESAKGILTYFNEKREKEVSMLTPLKGNYAELFDAVYEQIREGVPYPVKEKEILDQLEILAQPVWNIQS